MAGLQIPLHWCIGVLEPHSGDTFLWEYQNTLRNKYSFTRFRILRLTDWDMLFFLQKGILYTLKFIISNWSRRHLVHYFRLWEHIATVLNDFSFFKINTAELQIKKYKLNKLKI